MIQAIVHSFGTSPVVKDCLLMAVTAGDSSLAMVFSKRAGTSSGPKALLEFRPARSFSIFSGRIVSYGMGG